jgi:phosphoglycolate phosphatase-like HAD superfamily hydrolase
MLRLIFDFDGPIMDIADRYYRVYQICLEKTQFPDQKLNILSQRDFWDLKRDRIAERDIGKISGLNEEQCGKFAQLRHQLAHQLDFLVFDQPISGAIATLERLKQLPDVELVVMTMRKQQELELALKQHELERFFPCDRRYCIPNDYVKKSDLEDKPLLMTRALQELPPVTQTWMIGDKEADIVAAQKHQIKIIAVLSGIRNRSQLEPYQPDLIVNNVTEAINQILHLSLNSD